MMSIGQLEAQYGRSISLANDDLAEGERVGLDLGVEEGDLEGTVGDGAGLADELVQSLFGDRTIALAVHVGAVCGAGPTGESASA